MMARASAAPAPQYKSNTNVRKTTIVDRAKCLVNLDSTGTLVMAALSWSMRSTRAGCAQRGAKSQARSADGKHVGMDLTTQLLRLHCASWGPSLVQAASKKRGTATAASTQGGNQPGSRTQEQRQQSHVPTGTQAFARLYKQQTGGAA